MSAPKHSKDFQGSSHLHNKGMPSSPIHNSYEKEEITRDLERANAESKESARKENSAKLNHGKGK